MSLLKDKFNAEVFSALKEEFNYSNDLQVPKISKVVLNMGLGEAVRNPKIIDDAQQELTAIAGQKAVVAKARKSIATFKLRQGMPIGVHVTLRNERMWEFLERLIYVALPQVRDFRGVSPKGFDGKGNFTMGVKEHIVFPEIDYDKVERVKGLNISVVTTAETDVESRSLLTRLGMPFRKSKSGW